MIDCFAGKYIIHKLLGSGQRRPRVYSDGTKAPKQKNRHKESSTMKSFFDQSKLLTLFKVCIQSNEIMLVKELSMANLQFTAISTSTRHNLLFIYLFIDHLYIFIQLHIIAYV